MNTKSRINWCTRCNLALLDERCDICGNHGKELTLSGNGDIRPGSVYERELLCSLMVRDFGHDITEGKLLLFNKIPGEDRTDEVVMDGFNIGTLRFDMALMEHVFDPSMYFAWLIHGNTNKVVAIKESRQHLSGKKVKAENIVHKDPSVNPGDPVVVECGNMVGIGTYTAPDLRIKKIATKKGTLDKKSPQMEELVQANLSHIKQLGKNAMNSIKGLANQKNYKDHPVHVSFSGGKDSLVVLDLTLSALKKREVKAFFLNTGIEFPQTVEFARQFCKKHNIELTEAQAGNAFWENLKRFGPPAKDFRWCCKVCKLAPASGVIDGVSLTVDGKRRYESFSRANISGSEENPFVPGQLNIFPIRNWRALEVWLYIHWRKLEYNPLYDRGFERVGCYLCPAELSAEYERIKEIHPDLYEKWNSYLLSWAAEQGLSPAYIEHGFWRWKEHPPKMVQLAKQLGIELDPVPIKTELDIDLVSGMSACRFGDFTIEATVRGIDICDAAVVLNIMGEVTYSQELGMVLVKNDRGSVKMFSPGSVKVTAENKEDARALFEELTKQLLRITGCTLCGICLKACPVDAIEIGKLTIKDNCIRCGKCTQACVVAKYSHHILKDLS